MNAPGETLQAPVISVITATYNLLSQGREDSFRRVIDCMARQNCGRAEHIIQDGGSDDGTVEFIREVIAGLPHTRLISEPDKGLYDGMNRGVSAASGDYVLFLNSDDALASDDVLNAAADMLGRDHPDFLYGPAIEHSGEGAPVRYRMSLKGVLQRMPFCHNAVFLKREMFQQLGGHDTQFRIAADYDLVLRMISAGYRGERMEQPISLFWTRGASGDRLKTRQDYARVWHRYYAKYRAAQGLTVEDYEEFGRRGHLPARLLFEVMTSADTPAPIRVAARHSLSKTLRRGLQPWRKF